MTNKLQRWNKINYTLRAVGIFQCKWEVGHQVQAFWGQDRALMQQLPPPKSSAGRFYKSSFYLFPLTTSEAPKIQRSSLCKVCSLGKPPYFLKTKRYCTPFLQLQFKNNWASVVWYYLHNNSQSHPASFSWNLPIADPIFELPKDILVWWSSIKNIDLIRIKERNTDKCLWSLTNQPDR